MATPNRHLVVANGRVEPRMGPNENRHRPSIDVLFRSVATEYGPRAIGVVLTGALSDGALGLAAIARHGGVTVVQDPADAQQPSMPESAMQHSRVDHVLPLDAIGPMLGRLVEPEGRPKGEEAMPAQRTAKPPGEEGQPKGSPVAFACPECNGTLWEVRDGDLARYVCRVGHAYSEEEGLAANGANLERAFWTALRVLAERAAFHRRLGSLAEERGVADMVEHHRQQSEQADRDADTLRRFVLETLGRQVRD